ncbi:uncharacterized protein LOC120417887 [Culex pipiens pallens]|uniref:uncharacterized protein LOC120417887 n=1 Tax=Culex pipiens pallens TaxID=42434 RepID=UPI0019532723|nr:uncharacterized protein LOC120417887 [Culex pipiens pallens]
MQRTNNQDDPGVPLQSFEWESRNQQSTVPPAERDGYKDFEKIDVHNFTGLATILAVNVQQLYLLISVGPELGAMFYVLISITSVSAIFVVVLLPIRLVLEACKKIRDRRTWLWLYYTSLVLNVLIFVLNLVLQIFDQTTEKCQVLLNQPLPVAARDEEPK